MRNKLTAALGAAALTAAMLPSSVFAYWTSGYEVIVNGNSVGIVENELEVSSMLAVINYQLASTYGTDETINPDIHLRAKLVASEKLIDKGTLHDGLAVVSDKMTEAARITIDGAQSIYVENNDAVERAMTLITEKLGIEGGVSDVVQIIGSVTELAPAASIMTPEEAADYFIERNLLTVKTDISLESTEDFSPDAEEYTDPELYEGVRVTTDNGKRGKIKVTTVNSYVNGELTGTKESREVIDEGIPAKVAVGTKPRPAGVGTGSFSMPASGRLSSGFGARWGRNHNGIDIAAPVGTPVYASDDGVVTCAEYKGSFGNIVKIDHGNGFETYYAHNSQMLVSAGQTVTKGQLIAKMGSTGNSTGSHCHFEIHYNGEIKNPMNYLK